MVFFLLEKEVGLGVRLRNGGLFHHLNVDSHFSSCNLEFMPDRVVPVLLARRDEGLNIWSGMVFLVFSICWQGDLCLFSFLLFDERL